MNAFGVVVVHILPDGLDQRFKRCRGMWFPELKFERPVKRFLRAVSPRFPFGRPRWKSVLTDEPLDTSERSVFTALIRMKYLWCRPPLSFGLTEHIHDESGGVVNANLPGNNFARKDINDGSEVDGTAMKPQMGKIACPDGIRLYRAQELHSVRNFTNDTVFLLSSVPILRHNLGPNAVRTHDALNPFSIDQQVNSEGSRSIGRMILEDVKNAVPQDRISMGAFWFVVQRRARNTETFGERSLRERGRHTLMITRQREDFFY